MKKQLIVILIILLVLVAIASYYVYNVRYVANLAQSNNTQYEQYYSKEIIGTDLISLINKAIDTNEKNGVEKQENSIYYEDNEQNSIQIDVKFLETDRIISMEDIAQGTTASFVKYFATATFKCTNIEYHEKTNYVKSLYFEQIDS